MTYARFRRARKQEQAPEAIQEAALLDDAYHAHIHELVMSDRLKDMPVRVWLGPLDVIALEKAEADGYIREWQR